MKLSRLELEELHRVLSVPMGWSVKGLDNPAELILIMIRSVFVKVRRAVEGREYKRKYTIRLKREEEIGFMLLFTSMNLNGLTEYQYCLINRLIGEFDRK